MAMNLPRNDIGIDTLDDLFQEARLAIEQRRLRERNTYVRNMIEVLLPHKRGLRRRIVLNELRSLRRSYRLAIPPTFVQVVQKVYQCYSSQYPAFHARCATDSDDIFFSPLGKGTGLWAVHPERAAAWLTNNLTRMYGGTHDSYA
jgi:hypothetical protein